MSNRVQSMRLGGLQKQLEVLQQEKEKEREETLAVMFGIGIKSGEAWSGLGGHSSSLQRQFH